MGLLWEDGMRLKVDGPTILHANIHDNDLDRQYSYHSDTTNKLTSDVIESSTRWSREYRNNGPDTDTDCLAVNNNYKVCTLQLAIADDQDDQLSHNTSNNSSGGSSSSSSTDVSPEAEDYRGLSSDTESESVEAVLRRGRGIVNPNYPGFQHLADQLLSDSEDDNNNNSGSDKAFYQRPKLINDLDTSSDKMADAFLSGVKEEIQRCEDTNRAQEREDTAVPRKKERVEGNLNLKKTRGQLPANTGPARRATRDRKRNSPERLGSFDVYNIETAMPTIDLDAIESHLRAAREEERRRRNDREEIRRRLATGCDADEYFGGERPGRKPSLQSRLQSGMNLQICFMNDTMSDTESPGSDSEAPAKAVSPMKQPSPLAAVPQSKSAPPANSNIKSPRLGLTEQTVQTEADFYACQAKLQADARLALAQAKDMARLQMEVERQRKQVSPITDMLRATLLKVGVVFPEDRRRVSRQMLTDMNVAQLQVIVNDLHTQIEFLNESLVRFLMERDDLHMSQDSMLVDIEDLTRYLGAKEDIGHNNNMPKALRIAGATLAPK